MEESPIDITLLLHQVSDGDQTALGKLIPLVYDELRRLAAHHLRHERSDHTLQATALVHEAYLHLIDQRRTEWKNRNHFFGVAAQLMRRILLMYARERNTAKRGGRLAKVSLDEALVFSGEQTGELLILDELLTRLAAIDPQQGQIVELRFFGGLSVEETASFLSISAATVKRDWAMAKAWLAREMRAAGVSTES